jgi:5-methylcytosine-specific restriction endonuclease McrA
MSRREVFEHKTPRHPSRALRYAIFLRDGFRCVYCRSMVDLTADHVLAWARGGETEADNLVCACLTCNELKGEWPLDLFATLCQRDGIGRKRDIMRRVDRLLRRPLPKP